MKPIRFIFLIIILFLNNQVKARILPNSFVGTNVECYENLKVTAHQYSYSHLFRHFNEHSHKLSGSLNAHYGKQIIGKEYIISGTIPNIKYDIYTGWVIQFSSTSDDEILYCFYAGDGRYNSLPMSVPDNFVCPQYEKSSINLKYDKFSKTTTYYTPKYELKSFDELFALKSISADNDTIYTITFIVYDYYKDSKPTCTIIFENENKIEYSNAVIYRSLSSNRYSKPWEYTATIILTQDEFKNFVEYKITDIQIGGTIDIIDIPTENSTYIYKKFNVLSDM